MFDLPRSPQFRSEVSSVFLFRGASIFIGGIDKLPAEHLPVLSEHVIGRHLYPGVKT